MVIGTLLANSRWLAMAIYMLYMLRFLWMNGLVDIDGVVVKGGLNFYGLFSLVHFSLIDFFLLDGLVGDIVQTRGFNWFGKKTISHMI